MLLIQRHIMSTYGTYGTYANVTWVTADEHVISSLYPAYAYSNTNTYYNIRVNSTNILYPSQESGYTQSAMTGPQSGQYQATLKMLATFWESYYFGNSWTNRTNYWMYQSGSYTSSFWGYDGYTLTTNGNYTLTASRQSILYESGYPQLAFLATTSSISNAYIQSRSLVNGFKTNVANRMINYSTDSAFSTTFASTTRVTVTWDNNKYNMYTINETASFGHETQTTGTSYLTRSSTYSTVYYTRSSTYDTVYYTRSSTYSTVYHTRSSTSGYSGVSSSSSETSGWQ